MCRLGMNSMLIDGTRLARISMDIQSCRGYSRKNRHSVHVIVVSWTSNLQVAWVAKSVLGYTQMVYGYEHSNAMATLFKHTSSAMNIPAIQPMLHSLWYRQTCILLYKRWAQVLCSTDDINRHTL